MEIEIGRGKRGRRAYGLDEIAIVPSRRTRDPEDVDLSWQLGPHALEMPLLASAMDGVVSPATAIEIGKLGGLGVLNLEGIQSRYEDPDSELRKIAEYPPDKATAGLQDIYRARDVDRDLMVQRIREIKASGVLTAGSLTPQRVEQFIGPALDAGDDQRRLGLGDQHLATEEVVDRAAVARDGAVAGLQDDAGDRRLALAGCLDADLGGAHAVTFLSSLRGSGDCASCGCSGPA